VLFIIDVLFSLRANSGSGQTVVQGKQSFKANNNNNSNNSNNIPS
jgi:hypothetical protein